MCCLSVKSVFDSCTSEWRLVLPLLLLVSPSATLQYLGHSCFHGRIPFPRLCITDPPRTSCPASLAHLSLWRFFRGISLFLGFSSSSAQMVWMGLPLAFLMFSWLFFPFFSGWKLLCETIFFSKKTASFFLLSSSCWHMHPSAFLHSIPGVKEYFSHFN